MEGNGSLTPLTVTVLLQQPGPCKQPSGSTAAPRRLRKDGGHLSAAQPQVPFAAPLRSTGASLWLSLVVGLCPGWRPPCPAGWAPCGFPSDLHPCWVPLGPTHGMLPVRELHKAECEPRLTFPAQTSPLPGLGGGCVPEHTVPRVPGSQEGVTYSRRDCALWERRGRKQLPFNSNESCRVFRTKQISQI